jgi:cytochrome c
MKKKALLALVALLSSVSAHAQMSYAEGSHLMTEYGCSSCHALNRPLKGPALVDIARRYVSDPNAIEYLSIHVHNGSVGAWGPLVMPPVDVPDDQLQAMIRWIMQLPLQP